ncbi:hypothetical protein H4R24_003410 [Coemansia sp. RSA 988]|nr:hypothetical protein H4R24_003410 [Coemansia sp. RSA 988]
MRQILLHSARARILGASSPTASLPRVYAAARSYSVSLLPLVSTIQRSTRPSAAVFSRHYSADTAPETQPNVGPAEKHEFKAETKKLLHIVAHSLYSQREVFVRELISNASDALEKLRQLQTTSAEAGSDKPLEINITLDSEQKTITFFDSGIGMTADELKENLGTIARSGSKAFIEKMQSNTETSNAANSIVGQFGVGFYSAFMVGDKITVYTRSAKPGSEGYCWVSDGLGSYTLSKADNVAVGTKIVIDVKKDSKEFLDKEKLSEIIKKYSNFVGFPITVDGEKVNTIEALWTKGKSEITEEDHNSFYKFISHSWDDPMYSLVYKADAPLSIRSILYAPSRNPEAMGFERIKPGVSLYSRKVLIMSNAESLLPEWLRFVKGVVDSEDLPLNLSRELLQNGPVIMKLKSILSSRIIKWLLEEARKEPEKYSKFYNEFGIFLREGVCQDMANQKDIAKLLRFESSTKDSGKLVSLDEYIKRMPKDQEHIYYFCTPSRKVGAESPYYVPFEKHGTEVLFMHHQLDEFVMGRLSEYNGKRLISVDSAEAGKVLKEWNDAAQTNTADDASPPLTKEQTDELTSWMRESMGTQAKEVRVSERFMTYPAIVVDFDSPAVRRMMKMMSGNNGDSLPVSPCTVEINPRDPVIKGLFALKGKNEDLARKVAQQLLDNAMIAAGIMDDPRSMVKRLNEILAATVN